MSTLDWSALPSLATLRAFDAAARHGSFSAAARSLNVTHAAVAQQVRALETDLGVVLMQRSGRGMVLTADGARLAGELGEAFGRMARAVTETREAARSRPLRITATACFTHTNLMPGLSEFWCLHPDVPVSLTPDHRMHDLRDGAFDMAFRTGDGHWPDGEATAFARTPTSLVGAPQLVASGRAPQDLPWIGPLNDYDRRLMRLIGVDPARVTVNTFDIQGLFIEAAVQGLGLMFSTDLVCDAAVEQGRLARIPTEGLPEASYWIVRPRGPGGQSHPAADVFADWMLQRGPLSGASVSPGSAAMSAGAC